MATRSAAAPLGWSAKELYVGYGELLKSSPAFRQEISTTLDVDSWVKANLELDEGIGMDRVASDIGVSFDFIVDKVLPARVCLTKYKGQPEKIAECLEGRLRR